MASAPITLAPKFADIIRAKAAEGASFDAISDALVAAGLAPMTPYFLKRTEAYVEGRAACSVTGSGRRWSDRERDILLEGLRNGLNGPAIQRAFAAEGFVRDVRCITASRHYVRAKEIVAKEAAAAKAPEAPEAETEVEDAPADPIAADDADDDRPRFISRHRDFPGISLAPVAMTGPGWEIVAR